MGGRLQRFMDDPRSPARVLGAAMACATALILWMGHGTTFSGDEIVFVATSPHLDLRTVLEPHGGHLLALTRIVYRPMLDVFGLDYLPFRVLSVLTILLTVGLLFAWARRRVDPWVALLPCALLLFFGADPLHMFQGNGFPVMLSVALGIAALIAVERGDRRGDVACCAFLALGALAYSVILPFLLGTALLILWNRQWKRTWVVIVPLGLYLLWRVWLVAADVHGDGGGIELTDLLLVPSWAFQSVAEVLGALSGLGYDFTGGGSGLADPAGPALAVLALAALAVGVSRRGIGPSLAAAGLIGLALWAMQAVASGDAAGLRLPGDPRYQYPGAFVVLLIAFAAIGPARPSRRALGILAAATAAAIAVNVMVMRDGADEVRATSRQGESMAGALRLAGATTGPDSVDVSSSVGALAGMAASPYGDYGYGYERLRGMSEAERQSLDQLIAKTGEARVGAERTEAGRCGPATVVDAGSRAAVRSARGGPLVAGMLADTPTAVIGTLEPGRATALSLPAEGHRWSLSVEGGDLEVCR